MTPLIRVNTTSNAGAKGVDRSRATAVLDQLAGGASPQELANLSKEREANRAERKKRVHCTIGWIAEIAISSFKRRMGSAAKAAKMENMVIEIGHRITMHNRMLAVAREAIANALANGLVREGVRLTGLERRGMQEPFDRKYWNLPPPQLVDGKTPDLQGECGERLILGEAEMSADGSHTESQLDTLVRHVVRHLPVSLYVAVPFEYKNRMKDMLLAMAGHQARHRIWVWPFRKVGQTYAPDPRLHVE